KSVLVSRRLSRFAVDGGHRTVAKAQAPMPTPLHRRAGRDLGPALGSPRPVAHYRADVAAAPCLFSGRRARPTRARLRPGSAVTRAERRPAIKRVRPAHIAAGARLLRQASARRAKPNADRREKRAPLRSYRPCPRRQSLRPVWH